MTSRTNIRSWLADVVCRRSIASVAHATALLKPKVNAVAERSLSIVFGTPTTGTPNSWNCCATASDPSPLIQIKPERLNCSTVLSTPRKRSASRSRRSSTPIRAANLPLLVDPRIVPPRFMIPDVFRVEFPKFCGRWQRFIETGVLSREWLVSFERTPPQQGYPFCSNCCGLRPPSAERRRARL